MSNAALTTVFSHSKSEGLARLVLLSIADRADDKGRAFCGAKDLCNRTNADRSNVFRALKRLRESGELEVTTTKGLRGCNHYQIRLDQWHNATSGNTQPVAMRNVTSGNTPPKPIRTHNIDREGAKPTEQDFATFWQSYPRKTSKQAAIREWKSTTSERPPLAELLAALEAHKRSDQWQTARFIPHPATWLHGHRWNDDLNPTAPEIKTPRLRL
jgi:hypothetical protein